MKTVQITLTDETHAFLEQIKQKKGFSNNAEALEWIIANTAKKVLQ